MFFGGFIELLFVEILGIDAKMRGQFFCLLLADISDHENLFKQSVAVVESAFGERSLLEGEDVFDDGLRVLD